MTIADVQQSGYDGSYQIQSTTSTSFTVTNTNASLTQSSGGTATPLVFGAPPSIDGQFYIIAAPKDWLGNQSSSMAAADPLATFWDATIDAFFASGNFLSIYLGKDPNNPTYSGSSDGTQYTLSNGVDTYTFPKPTGGSRPPTASARTRTRSAIPTRAPWFPRSSMAPCPTARR